MLLDILEVLLGVESENRIAVPPTNVIVKLVFVVGMLAVKMLYKGLSTMS